jgi:uncharacterized protein (TIGR01777 family)
MSEQKRVIVTGATGLIGRAFCRALIEQGYGVVVFSRDPQAAQSKVPGALKYVAWQPSGSGPWAADLEGAYAVVHLAGESLFGKKISRKDVDASAKSKIESTRRLAEVMATTVHKPKVFINGSSIGYYGFTSFSDEKLTEESAQGSDHWANNNAAWEAAAQLAADAGIRTVLLRTGVVFGRDGGALVAQLPQFERGYGGTVAPGTQWFSWVHIDDQVGAMLHILEDERISGPVNVSGPNPVRHQEYAALIGQALGKPAGRKTPGWMLKWFMMGEPAEIIIHGRRMIPQKLLDTGYVFKFNTCAETVQDIVESYRHHDRE